MRQQGEGRGRCGWSGRNGQDDEWERGGGARGQ